MNKRWCYYINPTQNTDTYGGYVPSVVTENEAGHSPLTGQGQGSRPWIWGKTLDEAENICKQKNEEIGISVEDAWRIVASSMSAGRVMT